MVENYLAVCTSAGGTPKPEFQQVVGPIDKNSRESAKLTCYPISAALMSPRPMPTLLAVEIMAALPVSLGSVSLLKELFQTFKEQCDAGCYVNILKIHSRYTTCMMID